MACVIGEGNPTWLPSVFPFGSQPIRRPERGSPEKEGATARWEFSSGTLGEKPVCVRL